MNETRPSLFIARTCGLQYEHPACGTYIAQLSVQCEQSGLWNDVYWPINTNHRIQDSRNSLAELAIQRGASHILFIDPDMEPDIETRRADSKALPFFSTAMSMLNKLYRGEIEGFPEGSLGIVGAPALSGPPDFMVNVQVADESDERKYRRSTIQEAMEKTAQMERVVAVGTGLMLIPTEVFSKIDEPYFEDKYSDPKKRFVYSSQDTSFCFNCNNHGVSVWCSWYSWARHWKTCPIDRPTPGLLNFLRSDLSQKEGSPTWQHQRKSIREMEEAEAMLNQKQDAAATREIQT